MPKQQTTTDTSDANAALAYNFWLARCFRDGSPEEDLFRAVCANSSKFGVKVTSHSGQPASRNGKQK